MPRAGRAAGRYAFPGVNMKVPEITPPSSRDQILASLEQVHHEGGEYWRHFTTSDFFAPNGSAWSAADNVRHLLKSTRPVIKALRLPRIVLRALFGRARRPPMSFEGFRKRYAEALAAGGQAGRFAPSPRKEHDLDRWRAAIMDQREQVHRKLVEVVRRWADPALDRYCLPHPLLGRLTLREMLFFTLYHHVHHIAAVERRRSGASVP